MENSNNGISTYEYPLVQNDILEDAESQRKQVKKLFGTINESMGNGSACELLEQKLEEYNKIVFKNENNIYNTILRNTFSNVNSDRKFKIPQNLPKLELNSYLKDLDCGGKVCCTQSEQISQAELKQFGELLCKRKEQSANDLPITKPKITLESRFENLDKLQNPKQNNMAKVTANKSFERQDKFVRNKITVNSFVTAKEELHNQAQKDGMASGWSGHGEDGQSKKKLGTRGTGRSNKFVCPLLTSNESTEEVHPQAEPIDERLKNIEAKMVELIRGEIMDQGPTIEWDDIAGLQFAKSAIQEAVVWPMLRPDIFTGLRKPPKGILLFGPPGTGKTLIGKCVASQSKSTFFSISASSLTSKWIGDGEKMVRALFAVARVHQPAVIFIDEVDSLLTQRSDTEHESSRRIKTEFLVQLDGATTDGEERLLVIGATNRPQELDEAARRRFVRRLYIPLPEYEARLELVKKLMLNERHLLSEEHFKEIAHLSDGYSGADIKNLCSEASLGPIRSINFSDIKNIQASEVRPLTMDDFQNSFKRVRPSVSQNDLIHYLKWDGTYGSGSGI